MISCALSTVLGLYKALYLSLFDNLFFLSVFSGRFTKSIKKKRTDIKGSLLPPLTLTLSIWSILPLIYLNLPKYLLILGQKSNYCAIFNRFCQLMVCVELIELEILAIVGEE